MDTKLWRNSPYPDQVRMTDPDHDILQALTAGDHNALGLLMERHLHAIKSLAWHMLGDEMVAEDIAQEVFIKAWKQAPIWQSGNAKFSTWLHRVAKNLCYDRLRKKREVYMDTVPEMVDATDLAETAMITQDRNTSHKNHIDMALNKLPERQHMAITFCHYQNKSQNEAAAIMEINVRAYESLLARARQNLRKLLHPHKKSIVGGFGEHS